MAEMSKSDLEFTDILVLMGFRIEALEELLFEKNIITKEEFREKIYPKIDRGQIPETKEKLKSYMEKYYK